MHPARKWQFCTFALVTSTLILFVAQKLWLLGKYISYDDNFEKYLRAWVNLQLSFLVINGLYFLILHNFHYLTYSVLYDSVSSFLQGADRQFKINPLMSLEPLKLQLILIKKKFYSLAPSDIKLII